MGMKGKSIMFVGDSLGRNQWESLICMIYNEVPQTQTQLVRGVPLSTFRFLVSFLTLSRCISKLDLIHVIWHEQMFISGGSVYLISRFCSVVLGSSHLRILRWYCSFFKIRWTTWYHNNNDQLDIFSKVSIFIIGILCQKINFCSQEKVKLFNPLCWFPLKSGGVRLLIFLINSTNI